MGAVTSISKIDRENITQALTKATVNTSQTCSQSVLNSQTINLENMSFEGCDNVDFKNFSNVNNQNITFKCFQSTDNNTELIQNFKNELSTTINKNTSGIVIGANTNVDEQKTKIVNEITNQIDFNNFSNCVQSKSNEQIINLKNLKFICNKPLTNCSSQYTPYKINFENFGNTIVENASYSCAQTAVNNMDNTLFADTRDFSLTDITTKGLNLAELFGLIILPVLIAVIIIICIGIYGYYKKNGWILSSITSSKSDNTSPISSADSSSTPTPPSTSTPSAFGKTRKNFKPFKIV